MFSIWLYNLFLKLSPLTQFGGWGIAAWVVGILLTMAWVIGLHKSVRHNTAKTLGPISLVGLVLMTGIAVVGLAGALVGGFTTGLISQIPLVHVFPVFGAFVGKVVATLVQMIFMIGFGWYVLKNAGRLIEGLFNALKQPFQKGYNLYHLLAGAGMVAIVLNSASLNQSTFFIPMVLSALLGLYTLLGVRPQWSKIKDELAKGHAVEFGTLPNNQKIRTKKDRKILHEAYAEVDRQIKKSLEAAERERELAEAQAEVEKILNGQEEEDKWAALEKKMAVRKRIAEQLNLRLETEEETLARIEAVRQAEAAAQAEAEADQADEPQVRRHS